jgi:exosortase
MELFSLAILLALNYFQILWALVSDWWTDSDASQGLILGPLAVYAALARRHLLVADSRRGCSSGWGLLFLLASCSVLLAGQLGADFFLVRISFAFVIASLLVTFYGMPGLRAMALPLLLFLGSIPLPALVYNAASGRLQLLSSSLATMLAQSLGISIFQDGNIIHLAHLSLGVAESCSGIHSLSALMVASLIVGFIYPRRLPARLAVIAAAVPIAVSMNIIRIAGTAALADYRERLALGFYHSFAGWLVFLLGFALLWLLGRVLQRVGG